MNTPGADLRRRAVLPNSVRPNGPLTIPRSYGVYRVHAPGASRAFRFGNHPVRARELEQEFGRCSLEALFLSRKDAVALAGFLNANG